MRQGCIQCTLKHLGQAAVNIEECYDYPYVHKVLGHLSEAAEESREIVWLLGPLIRAHRLKWTEDREHYKIPFEAIERYIMAVDECISSDVAIPEVPEDCYEGLDKLASGEGYNLMTGDQR